MHDAHTILNAARSLLQQPPSQTCWEALCELLDALPEVSDALIAYVSAHVHRWPTHIERAADEDAFDWFEDARPSWSLTAINSISITQAHHLRALPNTPWAQQLAHLRLDLRELPTSPELVTILRALPTLESIQLSWSALHSGEARSTPLIKALSASWPPRLTHLALPCPTSHRALRLLGARLERLTSLAVKIDPQMAATLLKSPHIASLKALELRDEDRRGELAMLVAQAPGLKGLTSLTLDDAVGDELLELLAAPHLQQLEQLCCAPQLSTAATHQLLTMPWPAQLKLKDVHHLPTEEVGYMLLSKHPCMAYTTTLNYHCSEMITWKNLQAVYSIQLYNSDYTSALAANTSLSGLHQLSIKDRLPSLDECLILARCTHLISLRTLVLHNVNIEAERLQILTNAPWFAQLEHLELSETALHDDALSLLAAALPPNLQTLCLADAQLSAAGLARLLESPQTRHLEGLDLTGTSLGPAGVALLAKHPALGAIYGTDARGHTYSNMFAGMAIGDAELKLILDSPHFRPRPALSFQYNPITDEGISSLAQHTILHTARYLYIDCEDSALLALLSSPYAARLRSLSTCYLDEISTQTWREVSQLPHLSPTLRTFLDQRFRMSKRRDDRASERLAARGSP